MGIQATLKTKAGESRSLYVRYFSGGERPDKSAAVDFHFYLTKDASDALTKVAKKPDGTDASYSTFDFAQEAQIMQGFRHISIPVIDQTKSLRDQAYAALKAKLIAEGVTDIVDVVDSTETPTTAAASA